MKDSDLDLQCEIEFANHFRLKRRLERLKKKIKEDTADKSSNIQLPKEKVRLKVEPLKIKKTYKVLDRVVDDGWPKFLLQRNDGKRKTVNAAEFRELDKKGKIIGFVPAPPVNEKFQHARTPRGHFAIQVGAEGWRVDIVYSISSDWKDLMCYDHKLKRMMHYKREDLYPKENVNEAITFLQKLDEEERLAQKPMAK